MQYKQRAVGDPWMKEIIQDWHKANGPKKGAKYALACTGVCICGLLTCGEGIQAEPAYPDDGENVENAPTSPPPAVLEEVHVV